MSDPSKNVNEMLRDVDKVVKTDNLEEAMDLINQILEINPKNIYARAYNERITSLLKEKKEKREKEEQAAVSVPTVLHKQEEPQVVLPKPSDKGTEQAPIGLDRKLSDATFEAYKTLLNEVWKEGQVTSFEQERIDAMRTFFAVSKDEHNYFEQNARMTCYLSTVKRNWNKGIRNIAGLKEQFRLNDEEEAILKPKIERLIQSLKSKGVVLALDDDRYFLLLVKRLLEKNGYHVLDTSSGEEALTLLEDFSPDLILCDIAFGVKNMNGFMFYEKFRRLERFASTPFIFISALNQKELLRTGKKLGVDDYLTKPIDNDLLLAAVEGRIRRMREMQRTIDI